MANSTASHYDSTMVFFIFVSLALSVNPFQSQLKVLFRDNVRFGQPVSSELAVPFHDLEFTVRSSQRDQSYSQIANNVRSFTALDP